MYKCTISPFVGLQKMQVGGGLLTLKFGQRRVEIVELLNSLSANFSVVRSIHGSVDVYDNLGLHLHYDESDILEFVEVYSPCSPEYNNISLIKAGLDAVLKSMKDFGFDARYDDGGYFYDKLGFALFVPIDTIEAVSLFREGYYD